MDNLNSRPDKPGASLVQSNYESVRGEDVEEMQITELNVLGENRSKIGQ